MGESEQIESLRISLFGKGFGEFDGLGVAAGLEGFHRFFRGSFSRGGNGGGIVGGQRDRGLKGHGEC